jgi:putative DNA primase/helicase
LVHLSSFAAGRTDYSVPPMPRFFMATSLDYDFDAVADQPVAWLEFLGQLWPNDEQSIATLQEWFGYLLSPDTSQQKISMLLGP